MRKALHDVKAHSNNARRDQSAKVGTRIAQRLFDSLLLDIAGGVVTISLRWLRAT